MSQVPCWANTLAQTYPPYVKKKSIAEMTATSSAIQPLAGRIFIIITIKPVQK
jgi:hypothetical protein